MVDTVLSEVLFKVIVPIPMEATEDAAATTLSIALTASLTLIPVVLIPVISVEVGASVPPADLAVVKVADVVVVIPVRIWSALLSIIATLMSFAQEPGFLAATVTLVIAFSS